MFYQLTEQDKQAIASGRAVLLDVRRPDEFKAGHLKNARNFNVELIDAGQYPDIPKDIPIFTYCRRGVRAERAEQALTAAGFTSVKNIGGLTDINE